MKDVSIVIPVRNEEKHIEACLKQLLIQTYPKHKMELLIVDGCSEDKTKEIVEGFVQNNNSLAIKLLDNPRRQRAPALNIGIRESKGDVIMRVDARAIIPEDYIERCVHTLTETGADNVGGLQKPITGKVRGSNSLTQEAIGMALSHPFGVGDAQFRLGKSSGYVDTVYLGCFRKEIFDKVGLFDEEAPVISEDADMNYRIQKAGGKVYLNKEIVAYYYPRDNFKDLARLYFRYGGAKAGNLLKHKILMWRQFVPPFFLVTLCGLFVFSFIHLIFFIMLIALLGLYILIDVLACLNLALRKHKILFFPRLLVVFPCIHFSWGLGFLKRLFVRPHPGQYWGY